MKHQKEKKLVVNQVEAININLKQYTEWLRLCQECALQESHPQFWIFPYLQELTELRQKSLGTKQLAI